MRYLSIILLAAACGKEPAAPGPGPADQSPPPAGDEQATPPNQQDANIELPEPKAAGEEETKLTENSTRIRKSFDIEPGSGVQVSGEVTYDGEETGIIRIDFLKQEERIELAHTFELTELGPFTAEAPKGSGKYMVTAVLDKGMDGPTIGEPISKPVEIEVKDAAISGIKLKLEMPPELPADGDPPPPPAPPK